jgi:hypothetical protein
MHVENPGVAGKLPTEKVTPMSLASALNLGADFQGTLPEINQAKLLIYTYDPAQRIDPEVKANAGHDGIQGGPPTLPLPPVPESIKPGEHYVVNDVLFTLPLANVGKINWRAFVDVKTAAILYLRAGVAHATGSIYQVDPITVTGNSGNTPSAPVATLDGFRTSVTLTGLAPPIAASPRTQSLTGEFVTLVDIDPPTVAPPTRESPFFFDSSVDTDDFAAVNAYHHCDSLFRLVQSLGIDVKEYFDETRFPVPVDHRAMYNQVNAQAPINATWTGSDGFRFGIAKMGTTVGIAADRRVVLHEFSHALLEDSVHSPNFGFAHSAGDSLAVILSDPESRVGDRFVSFPWVDIGRRHDRKVTDGWGWGGTFDINGYSSEQILSTTMFRGYRAIGGDSTNINTKKLAARYQVNLIVRGIGLLATDPITGSPTPDVFETAMITADLSTPTIEGYAGGAVHKIVRWAFEKQGLHRAPGVPTTSEGSSPPVDVYIDDGRHGEYAPYLEDFSQTSDIWNRTSADGMTDHQMPVPMADNFLYVRVKNRGSEAAHNVKVHVYYNKAGNGQMWPTDWQPVKTEMLPATGDPTFSISAGASGVVGPFHWMPGNANTVSLLAAVSATDANADHKNDLSNIDPTSMLPCSNGPIAIDRLVPFDNNIAVRKMTVMP